MTTTVHYRPVSIAPVIAGQWQRQPDGSIVATYTPDELRMAVWVGEQARQVIVTRESKKRENSQKALNNKS